MIVYTKGSPYIEFHFQTIARQLKQGFLASVYQYSLFFGISILQKRNRSLILVRDFLG